MLCIQIHALAHKTNHYRSKCCKNQIFTAPLTFPTITSHLSEAKNCCRFKIDLQKKSISERAVFRNFQRIQHALFFSGKLCLKLDFSLVKGECYSASECSGRGGTYTSSCARQETRIFYSKLFLNENFWFWVVVNTLYSGFGVCCYSTITACGGTATRNQTYLRNPGYTGDHQRIMAGTVLYPSLNILP